MAEQRSSNRELHTVQFPRRFRLFEFYNFFDIPDRDIFRFYHAKFVQSLMVVQRLTVVQERVYVGAITWGSTT